MRSFVAVLFLCSFKTHYGRRLLAAEHEVLNDPAAQFFAQMSEEAPERTQMAAMARLLMSLNPEAAFSGPAAEGRTSALRAMRSGPPPAALSVWKTHLEDGTDETAQENFTKLGLSHKQRNTLLSRCGVGNRINSPAFWAGLNRLRTEWNMDAPQLVTFMSNSVAARIDSPEFWVGLDRLRSEYGIDTPQLVKFMTNSVAARIESPDSGRA